MMEIRHCSVCNQMTNHSVEVNKFEETIRTDYDCLKCKKNNENKRSIWDEV